MIVSIIAAMSRNRIIGVDGSIPWNIPADMSRFRGLTLGHTVIMGRKTFESIGRPLSGRKNIIISRDPSYHFEGALTASSLNEALELAEDDGEVFICGGGEIYQQALPLASRIYLTIVDIIVEGDTMFPLIPHDDFKEVSKERISEDPPADFMILERKVIADRVCSG